MTFSWAFAKQRAIDNKIADNISMAKSQSNKEFKKAHPDWCRDAQQNNYTQLKLNTTKDIKEKQELAQARREKRIGK